MESNNLPIRFLRWYTILTRTLLKYYSQVREVRLFETLFGKISNHPLCFHFPLPNCRNSKEFQVISTKAHAIRLSSSCSPLDSSVDTFDGAPKIFEERRKGASAWRTRRYKRARRSALNKRSFSRIGAGRPWREGGRARFRGKNRVSGDG